MQATSLLVLSIFFSPSFLFTLQAEDPGRSPHGLSQERPMTLSPAAFDFFHPTATAPCSDSNSCAPQPLPSAASKRPLAAQVTESSLPSGRPNGPHVGAGGVIGIVFGCAFLVAVAMGVYYVMVTRKSNVNKAKSVQSGV